jgi:Na+/melibiose symporter-like transporter
MIVLLAGGAMTSLLIAGGSQVLPILQQVSGPDASPTSVLPWKANQLFILIGFALFNLVGIAITLAVIFWAVDWGLKQSKAEASNAVQVVQTPQPEAE